MDRLDTPLIFICLLKKTWFFSWGYTSLNQPVCLASLNRKSQIDMDFLMELQSIINHIKTLEIRTKVSLCFYISLSTISPQNMAGYIYIYSHTSLFCSKKTFITHSTWNSSSQLPISEPPSELLNLRDAQHQRWFLHSQGAQSTQFSAGEQQLQMVQVLGLVVVKICNQ